MKYHRRISGLIVALALIPVSSCSKDSGETAGSNVAPGPVCPAGYQWNGSSCVQPTGCPAGQVWNGQGCSCPAGQQWTGQYCVGAASSGNAQGSGGAAGTASSSPLGTAHAPATPIDVSAAPGLRAPIDMKASQVAPGATAIGNLMVGQFQPGQALEGTIEMQPGKCYSVVAEAVPGGISELNIELLAQVQLPGVSSPILAEDKTTGPSAVLGAHPNCYRWAFPFAAPMKLVVWAAAGGGLAAAQVYEK